MREGPDYIILPDGRLVFTAKYLSERGYCCGNGCLNCPYDFDKVPEPKKSNLLAIRDEERSRKQSGYL